jgi:hypothetical protein
MYEPAMRHLIDTYIRAEESEKVSAFDDISLIQLIVDDLLGRTNCPSTGESARRTSEVMDRVLEGYYGGRTDAFWLRPATWPGRSSTYVQP